jgi:hypothetical protein
VLQNLSRQRFQRGSEISHAREMANRIVWGIHRCPANALLLSRERRLHALIQSAAPAPLVGCGGC